MASPAINKKTRSWISNFVKTNPDASVDDIAREANKKHIPATKALIAAVRRTPQLTIVQQDPQEENTPETRRAYVNDLILKNPDATIKDVIEACKKKYGKAVDYNYVIQTKRTLKEAETMEVTPPTSVPAVPPAMHPEIKTGEKYMVFYMPKGETTVQQIENLDMNSLADRLKDLFREGVDMSTVTAWKSVPVSLSFDVKIG